MTMETIILRRTSDENARLILQLAKKLNFSAQHLSEAEAEEYGIFISINDGLESGMLEKKELDEFVKHLTKNES